MPHPLNHNLHWGTLEYVFSPEYVDGWQVSVTLVQLPYILGEETADHEAGMTFPIRKMGMITTVTILKGCCA